MFGLGAGELVLLAVIVLVVFGGRIPTLMKSLGSSVPAFRKGLTEEN